MPIPSRFQMPVLLRLALAAAAFMIVFSAPAFGAVLADEPVSVIAVAPVSDDAGLKALLASEVGGVSATTPVRRTEGKPALTAQSLSAKASAARSYGNVRLSAFRMTDESLAYALLRFLRPDAATVTESGDDGWAGSQQTAVRLGDVVIHASGGSDAQRFALCEAVVAAIGRPAPNAPIADELPGDGRLEGTVRYVSSFEMLKRFRPDLVEDVYRLGIGGADAIIADYAQGDAAPARLLIVEYLTPQLAAEAQRSVTAWFDGLDPATRATRVLKREGNYLIEAVGVSSPEAFRPTVDSVKYDYQIKMLQGPNPAVGLDAAKEAYTTAMVLLGSVRLVGAGALLALTIGMAIGTVLFMRRRKAAANIFSDAGGMVHLKLDGPVRRIEPRREPRGLLSERSGQ